jgi:hypothetical protein
MMKIIVVLYGPGGEINHKIITVIAHDPPPTCHPAAGGHIGASLS